MIKKCKNCGSDEFIVKEVIFHEASIDPDDLVLIASKADDHWVEKIICQKCYKEYSVNYFQDIQFC